MPEAVRSLTAKEPLQGAEPERADSKVLSDEEVEEAEASDSFPALGYPARIGSIGSGEVLTGPVAALRRFPPWPARLVMVFAVAGLSWLEVHAAQERVRPVHHVQECARDIWLMACLKWHVRQL